MNNIHLEGLGIDPVTVTALVSVATKGIEAVVSAITRPRQDEHWAGAGEYEERFLREMFFAFPTDKYQIIDTNAPFLVELYDFLVSYGKATYPNKRGMVGAGDDMREVAKRYVQDFIRDSGGAQQFAFLFKDLEAEMICQQRKQAVLAQIEEAKKVIRNQKITKNVKKGLTIVMPTLAGIGLVYWLYRRYQTPKNLPNEKKQTTS
jgi:hypothetical protein